MSFSQKESSLKGLSLPTIKRDISIVQVFYAESFFRAFVKEELIGFTEFLSNTGGLLGLFMGFSVLSLVEILYFISLRPYCRRLKRKSKAIHERIRKIKTISHLIPRNRNRLAWPSNAMFHPTENRQRIFTRNLSDRVFHIHGSNDHYPYVE